MPWADRASQGKVPAQVREPSPWSILSLLLEAAPSCCPFKAEVITHLLSLPIPLLNSSQIAPLSLPACFLWGPWLDHSLTIFNYLCTSRRKTHAFSLFIKAWISCPNSFFEMLSSNRRAVWPKKKRTWNWRSEELGLGSASAINSMWAWASDLVPLWVLISSVKRRDWIKWLPQYLLVLTPQWLKFSLVEL